MPLNCSTFVTQKEQLKCQAARGTDIEHAIYRLDVSMEVKGDWREGKAEHFFNKEDIKRVIFNLKQSGTLNTLGESLKK